MLKLKTGWAEALRAAFKNHRHTDKGGCPCHYMTAAKRIKEIGRLIAAGDAIIVEDELEAII